MGAGDEWLRRDSRYIAERGRCRRATRSRPPSDRRDASVGRLVERAVFSEEERRRSADVARRLVRSARASHEKHGGVDAFMREYGLSTEEGVILMCLAEALLRIPDRRPATR